MRWLDLLFAAAVLAATFCGGPPPAAYAIDYHWIGAGTGGNIATDPADPTTQWSNPVNWQEGAAPGPGDTPLLPLANAGYVYAQSGQVSGLLVNGSSAQGAYYIGDGADVTMPPLLCLAAGYSGMGRVLQTGGSLTTTGVVLGGWDVCSGWGSYELQGGTLAVTGSSSLLDIGYRGTGVFTQTGGTLSVQGTMYVGRMFGNGVLNVGGGTLRAGTLEVGRSEASGTLNITDSAATIEASCFVLWQNSTLSAVPGSQIHIVGGPWFRNYSKDENALSGLENVTLIFDAPNAVWDTFEVAGLDQGSTAQGFRDNFALEGLIVGGAIGLHLTLVDQINNDNRSSSECLYVHNLIVNSGSVLDLNGLRLYYDGSLDNTGSVIGGTPIFVPEPAALSILGAGLALIWTRLLTRRVRFILECHDKQKRTLP
jgi:hypothetical protein